LRASFNDLAERELNDAAAYYEVEQPGLGDAFISDVDRCVQALVAHPLCGTPLTESIRRCLCQRFPYAVLYRVTTDEIRILAVMHLRRRPGYWVGRS
jgi:plasmid stabilization system protein ParE